MHILHKNTRVHFSSIGKGTAVVLIHGFLENNSMWNDISKNLSKKYRVISIDLLGHGKTENHGYVHTMEAQSATIKTVLNHLRLRKNFNRAQYGWLRCVGFFKIIPLKCERIMFNEFYCTFRF